MSKGSCACNEITATVTPLVMTTKISNWVIRIVRERTACIRTSLIGVANSRYHADMYAGKPAGVRGTHVVSRRSTIFGRSVWLHS